MLLIADSGGTKTDWRLIQNRDNSSSIKTLGINPYYLNEEQIRNEIRNNFTDRPVNESVEMIYFYGAGCSGREKQEIVQSVLNETFTRAEIEINSDVLGAARALCRHEAGIACVIGTGSGSCLYDGKEIRASIPSLGFILGDEGGGAYLGKRLLQDYLRGDMPQEIISDLRAEFEINKDLVLENVNRRPMPGRYLASFSEFIHQHVKSEYIHNLVYSGFGDFIDHYITRYPECHTIPAYFSGSIAYYFSDILKSQLKISDIRVARIIESPMNDLVDFHIESL
jgi:N-acetylglucosamine kinase-like BadF-type ATPase